MKKLILLALIAVAIPTSKSFAQTHVVTVELHSIVSSNFLGYGVNWCPYPWFDLSESEWQTLFKRMDYMRPAMARVMLRAFHYCDGFDADGKPIYDWDSPRMKKLYRLLDYCQRRKITVILGEWESPRDNGELADHALDKLQPLGMGENDPRWHRLIADCLEHLLNEKHYTCIKYYNLINEPNGSWSGVADFSRWQAAMKSFHAELKRRGLLKQISLIGPDACQFEDSWWLDFTVRKCASLIGLYDLHLYAKPGEVESGVLETFYKSKRFFINRFDPRGAQKPFLMSEAGMERTGPCQPQGGSDSQAHTYEPIYGIWMADYNIQCARAGMQGVLAWSVDDAEHIMNNDKGWPDIHKTLFKKWGFWNSLGEEIGHPEDTHIRPWFYTWSLMSRYFPAGCTIVKSSQPDVFGVRALAATTGEDEISIALVNDSDTAQSLEVNVPAWQFSRKLYRYDFSATNRLADADGFPVPQKIMEADKLNTGVTLDLPSRSFVLLTTLPK